MEYYTIVTVFLLLLLLRLFYSYMKQPLNYWKKLGVPEVPPIPIIGSMWEFIVNDNVHLKEEERYKKYGRIYGFYESTKPVLTVGEPALLKNIFVKDFQIFPSGRDITAGDPFISKMVFAMHGEDWKRVRTIITPAFTTGKMKKMFSIISDSASLLVANCSAATKKGQNIDMKRLFGAFTMDVIASCAFGTKVDSHNNPDNPFVTKAKKAFAPSFPWNVPLLFLFPKLSRFLGIALFDISSMKFFNDVTLKIIKERTSTPALRQNDLLQLMIDAAEEAKKGELIQDKDDLEEDTKMLKDTIKAGGEGNVTSILSKGLSLEEVVANCIMFFIAGYETTATLLSDVSYLLALNPTCQEKLIKEVDESIKRNGNNLNYEALQDMKYLDMVIMETLRYFPPAIRTERMAQQDYKLGDTGITVKKGMSVVIPIYAMHHDPEFYPDPEKFEPLRFSPEEKARRDANTWLPFGAGPRSCLGMRFALVEAKICIAYTVSQFRFKRCPETKVPLEFNTSQGILQPKSVILKLEERTDKVFHP